MDTRHSPRIVSDHSAHAAPRPLVYLEFQSKLLVLTSNALRNKTSTLKAYNLLVESSVFDEMPIIVNWPSGDDIHEIKIVAAKDEFLLSIFCDETLLFTMQVGKNQLTIQLNQASLKLLNLIDVEAIVHNLNQLFRANKIIYKKNQRESVENITVQSKFHYRKDEFDHLIDECSEYPLTYRINHLFVNSARRRGDDYTLTLDWPDTLKKAVNHELKVTFSRAENFKAGYSWVLNEPVLLNSFAEYKESKPLAGQKYYNFTVKEVVQEDEYLTENEILSLWLSVDGIVGELRDVKKGSTLTGTDVLAIYRYLDEILKVKHTFICDAARLYNKDESIEIPLRLLNALCTGKTWYEAKLPGVRLFDCKRFPSAFDGTVTQNTTVRNKALKELQELKLYDWYVMLDDVNKKMLLSLYANSSEKAVTRRIRSTRLFAAISSYKPELYFANKTVQDLAISLNNQAKSAGEVTDDLAHFIELLTQGLHLDDDLKPNKKASDYWVLQRVHTLLRDSFFWIKELGEAKPDVETDNKATTLRRLQ